MINDTYIQYEPHECWLKFEAMEAGAMLLLALLGGF